MFYSKGGVFVFIHLFIVFVCACQGVAKDKQHISFKDLFGTSWQAVKIDNLPVTSHWPTLTIKTGRPKAYILSAQDRAFIKKFKADVIGQVDGASSCNFYSAGFVLKGQKIRFLSTARTLMLCYPLKRMELEEKYAKLFRSVTHWRMENEQLILSFDKGQKTIHYDRLPEK